MPDTDDSTYKLRLPMDQPPKYNPSSSMLSLTKSQVDDFKDNEREARLKYFKNFKLKEKLGKMRKKISKS